MLRRIDPSSRVSFLEWMRRWLLCRWRRSLTRSLVCWLTHRYGGCAGAPLQSPSFLRHRRLGVAVLRQAFRATWWGWEGGSSLFFWRWPPSLVDIAIDGFPSFVSGPLPTYRTRQRRPNDPTRASQLAAKLQKARDRGYIQPGTVTSLTGFFPVPKGSDDIRIVYDATKCSLNKALWSPNFGLPMVDTLLTHLLFESWMGDIDLGEIFLNFPLDPSIRPYAGVDLTSFRRELDITSTNKVVWERWVRNLMGFRPSPFNAV